MINIKVTVVGFWGGFPAAGEATSGYLFELDNFRLLIDCGSGVISNVQKYINIEKLDAVVVSHYHHDHVADIGPLQYAMLIQTMLKNRNQVLPIYGHTEDQPGFEKLTHSNYTVGHAYDPEQKLEVGPFSISFLKTKHPVPCYAMKIEGNSKTVVYTADSSFQEDFIRFSSGADLLICECNLYAGMDGSNAGHMNSTEAALIAKQANVKQLLLTHLPHFGNHQDLINDARNIYEGQLEIASSGWSIKL